jgi:redox-sensitive bicupin YhaK (pirin superfamily)
MLAAAMPTASRATGDALPCGGPLRAAIASLGGLAITRLGTDLVESRVAALRRLVMAPAPHSALDRRIAIALAEERQGTLRLVGSHDGRDGSVTIHQDVDLYTGLLAQGDAASFALRPGRRAWLQVARGRLDLNGRELGAGDGAAISGEDELRIKGVGDAELLLFDLAS